MGFSRNWIYSNERQASFPLPKGVHYVGAQYVSPPPQDILTVELVLSNSDTTIEAMRNDALAQAQREGYRSPVIEGNRFLLKTPVRHGSATQQDVIGWVIPGKAIVVVRRNAHQPVPAAQELLTSLTRS